MNQFEPLRPVRLTVLGAPPQNDRTGTDPARGRERRDRATLAFQKAKAWPKKVLSQFLPGSRSTRRGIGIAETWVNQPAETTHG